MHSLISYLLFDPALSIFRYCNEVFKKEPDIPMLPNLFMGTVMCAGQGYHILITNVDPCFLKHLKFGQGF